MKEVYSTSVGAKFGEQALNETIFAGIIGMLIIYLFMLVYYRFPGFIATITLSIYIYLVLLVFDWMNGVLTFRESPHYSRGRYGGRCEHHHL